MVFEAAVSLCKPLVCTVAIRYATSTSRLAVCLYIAVPRRSLATSSGQAPMATSWSLEKELCGLVRARSVREALLRLHLIEKLDPDPLLQETQGWTQAHPEAFVYQFRVVLPQTARELVLKAIVAFSMAKSLVELAEEWIGRRRLLEREGVRTSKLYYAKRAVLVEQFVADKLSDHLRCSPTERLFDQVIVFAAILEKHRILLDLSVSWIKDRRARCIRHRFWSGPWASRRHLQAQRSLIERSDTMAGK